MPTYKYEALDTNGKEVKDTVDAGNEEEAQQKIKQMGYFVTKITEVAGSGKAGKKKKKGKKAKTFVIGGVSSKALCTFTRQFSTLQDAGLPVLRSLRILEHQMKPGALVKFVAQYRARRDYGALNEILSTTFAVFATFGVVTYLVAIVIAVYLGRIFHLSPDQIHTGRVVLLIISLNVAAGTAFSVFGFFLSMLPFVTCSALCRWRSASIW